MLEFLLKVATISSSGALAPGPLSAATAAIGTKNGWKGGFMVSLGHLIVEAPIIFLVAFLISLATIEAIIKPLAILGGLFLVFFGYLTLKGASGKMDSREVRFSPFVTGILLTGLNPFFIIWWFSVGSALVAESIIIFGSIGAVILLFSHVWIDFAWLSAIAYVTSLKGVMAKVHRYLLIFLGSLVIFFGLDYLYFAVTNSHLFVL